MSKSRWVTGRGGDTEAAIVPPSRPGGGGGRCARPPGGARALWGCAPAPPSPQALCARAPRASAPPRPEPLPCTRAWGRTPGPEPYCARALLASLEGGGMRALSRARARALRSLCPARAGAFWTVRSAGAAGSGCTTYRPKFARVHPGKRGRAQPSSRSGGRMQDLSLERA